MRPRPRPPRLPQPDLFNPPPNRPTWHALPPGIQQQVRHLLAQLLESRVAPRPDPAAGPEVVDE